MPTGLAPIALFTYNRPVHTRRTVEALRGNRLARQSDLVIYSDGPKDFAAAREVAEVRRYLRTIDGFRSITLVEQEHNLGLARSIISGVSRACNDYGKVIVVEDDLVTSGLFLDYMNEALDVYRTAERVMHISAYMYPVDETGLQQTFLLPVASCWGWATWQHAWRHFSKDPERLKSSFTASDRRRFNLDNSFPYWSQVEMNAKASIDTWAIFWYASIFKRGGLCLHPRTSYVQNIGHDDSGQHSDASDIFDVTLNPDRVNHWCGDQHTDPEALRRLQSFFWNTLPARTRARLALESLIHWRPSRRVGDVHR